MSVVTLKTHTLALYGVTDHSGIYSTPTVCAMREEEREGVIWNQVTAWKRNNGFEAAACYWEHSWLESSRAKSGGESWLMLRLQVSVWSACTVTLCVCVCFVAAMLAMLSTIKVRSMTYVCQVEYANTKYIKKISQKRWRNYHPRYARSNHCFTCKRKSSPNKQSVSWEWK